MQHTAVNVMEVQSLQRGMCDLHMRRMARAHAAPCWQSKEDYEGCGKERLLSIWCE